MRTRTRKQRVVVESSMMTTTPMLTPMGRRKTRKQQKTPRLLEDAGPELGHTFRRMLPCSCVVDKARHVGLLWRRLFAPGPSGLALSASNPSRTGAAPVRGRRPFRPR